MSLRLPARLTQALFDKLIGEVAAQRAPDHVIGGHTDPYLQRWWVIPRNPLFNIYLHRILRSDDDRALHDHPWFNLSLLLAGAYVEHTIAAGGVERRVRRAAGDLKIRSPWAAHRLELVEDETETVMVVVEGQARRSFGSYARPECWTLFVTGPRLRTWGFHCPRGWTPWKVFCAVDADGRNTGAVGRGCGEGSL